MQTGQSFDARFHQENIEREDSSLSGNVGGNWSQTANSHHQGSASLPRDARGAPGSGGGSVLSEHRQSSGEGGGSQSESSVTSEVREAGGADE